MSQQINSTRLKKMPVPRKRIAVYLPAAEVAELNRLSKKQGISLSSLVLHRYMAGKEAQS